MSAAGSSAPVIPVKRAWMAFGCPEVQMIFSNDIFNMLVRGLGDLGASFLRDGDLKPQSIPLPVLLSSAGDH